MAVLNKSVVIYSGDTYFDVIPSGTPLEATARLDFQFSPKDFHVFYFGFGQMQTVQDNLADYEDLFEFAVEDFPHMDELVVVINIRVDETKKLHVVVHYDDLNGNLLGKGPYFGPFDVD
ncbi:MAG: hypothetical protein CUN56_06855 [Phototrophicales bacterium]|nr:MAG: hypothetical protein CUN56_06855 [Phototrophicales bacterium]